MRTVRWATVVVAVCLVVAVVLVTYAAGSEAAPAEAGRPLGRYCVAVSTTDTWLVDTQTGRVWKAVGGKRWVGTEVEGLNGALPAKED